MKTLIIAVILSLALLLVFCGANYEVSGGGSDEFIFIAGSTDNQDRGMIHLEHASTGVSVPGLYVVNRSDKAGDGGVGIKVWNVYNSDGIYIKTDGKTSTGLAIDVVGGMGIQMKIWGGNTPIWIYDSTVRGLMRLDGDGTLHLRRGKTIKYDL